MTRYAHSPPADTRHFSHADAALPHDGLCLVHAGALHPAIRNAKEYAMHANAPALLSNRTIVITGGFGVLGRTLGEEASNAGNRIALIDRGTPPSHLGEEFLAIGNTDLARHEDARRAFDTIESEFGPVDVLFNVAGAFEYATVADSNADLWLQLYAANVLAVVNACRAALPLLRPGSAIVNVAAAAARRGTAGMAPYAAAKSGVLRLTEALAEELRGSGVRVNAVSPTIIDTPRNRQDMPGADCSTWVRPETLARMMLLLASDGATATNGADVHVGV